MRYFFTAGIVIAVISAVILPMQQLGSLTFGVTVGALVCGVAVAVAAAIMIIKNKR